MSNLFLKVLVLVILVLKRAMTGSILYVPNVRYSEMIYLNYLAATSTFWMFVLLIDIRIVLIFFFALPTCDVTSPANVKPFLTFPWVNT